MRFQRLVTLFLLLLLGGQIARGQNTDSLLAEDWAQCFQTFRQAETSRGDSLALEALHAALPLLKKSDALERWLFLQQDLALLLSGRMQQPIVALASLDSAAAALQRWRPPQTIAENTEHCYFYLTSAHLAKQEIEDFLRAKNDLEIAYRIFHDSLGGRHNPISRYLYFQLANAHVRMGEFESARILFEEGLAYSLRNDYPPTAKYSDHGDLYLTQGKFAPALEIFRQGLKRKNLPENDQIFNQLSLAECLAKMGNYPEATRINRKLEQYVDRMDTSSANLGKRPEYRCGLYENYAVIASGKKAWPEAIAWYQRARDTMLNYDRSSRRQIAFYQIEIGKLFLERQLPDSALLSFHQALTTILPGFHGSIDQQPDTALYTAENIIFKALEGKARSFELLGHLEKALDCYVRIPVAEAKLRATHDYESSTLRALQDSRARLDRAVELAWRLSDGGARPEYRHRAFQLMELARATMLLGQLGKTQALAAMPDSLKAREYALQKNIAWQERERVLELAKGDTMDARRYKLLDDGLFALKTQLKNLRAAFPTPAHTLAEGQRIDASELAGLLTDKTALIEYHLCDSSLFIFSASADGALAWRRETWTESRGAQARTVVQYVTHLNEQAPEKKRYQDAAAALFDLLLRPELERLGEVEALVLIPDGALTFLPFEILLTQTAAPETPFARLPYLVRQQSISYAFSSTMLRLQHQIRAESTGATRQFGAFIAGYKPGSRDPHSGEALSPLDGIRNAALSVEKILGGGASAFPFSSESNFRKQASEFAVLLLGMHGFSEDEHPELARLICSDPRSAGADNDDNILYANELQLLRLHANLAVLLACETGRGKWQRGEGVFSLARAFALAGVPSTLMSYWKLPDRSAQPLMQVFFEKIKAGQRQDCALQAAKLAYLNDPAKFEEAHPFFWANLVITGDTGAVYTNRRLYLLGAGAGILCLLLVFFYRQRHGSPPAQKWTTYFVRR